MRSLWMPLLRRSVRPTYKYSYVKKASLTTSPEEILNPFLEETEEIEETEELEEPEQTPRMPWMQKDIGKLIRSIEYESIELDENPVASKSGFQTLCSYNWHSNGKAIFVPGSPRRVEIPGLPIPVSGDVGRRFMDEDSFRMSKYPFEPALQAMSIISPDAELHDVDIIANRNSLRKLLKVAGGQLTDSFSLGLQMVRKTLFITRRERQMGRLYQIPSEAAHGFNFQDSITKLSPGLGDSGAHYRLIRYRLGSLDCVVRFEVDAYYNEPTKAGSAASKDSYNNYITARTPTKDLWHRTSKKSTAVVQRGALIPSSKLAEIKAWRSKTVFKAMPQLWLGRTPYLFFGRPNGDEVSAVRCTNVEPHFAQWETDHQSRLRKLAGLLMQLKQITSETASGTAVLIFRGKAGPIEMYERVSETKVLPEDLIVKFWGASGAASEPHSTTVRNWLR